MLANSFNTVFTFLIYIQLGKSRKYNTMFHRESKEKSREILVLDRVLTLTLICSCC